MTYMDDEFKVHRVMRIANAFKRHCARTGEWPMNYGYLRREALILCATLAIQRIKTV